MNINIFSEERVNEEEHTKDFRSTEIHPSSITTDYAKSLNAEKTDVQIEKTSSTPIVVSEAIESEESGCSNSSQNLVSSNQIDVIKENEIKDDDDKKRATVIPASLPEVKMIGSLGLLSQYASSSEDTGDTEDEDSNSDETESSQASHKRRNQTDLLAKNILDNATSQGGYRSINVDAYDY